MIGLILRSLWNQKRHMFLFIMAFGIILITLPLAFTSMQEAITQIEDDITEHARGSYDILLRPEGARSDVEQALGVVEENYLSVGHGGMTLEEWEDIRDRDDVDIAAPVASLGYFTGEAKSFALWEPETSVRVGAQFYTSDGLNDYPLNEDEDSIGILIEQEHTPQVTPPFDIFSKNEAIFEQWTPPSFMLPNTYHLMAGIDPESEEQLTGMSFEQIKEPYDEESVERDPFDFAGDAPVINVMKLTDPEIPVFADVLWEQLDIDEEQTAAWKDELGVEQDEPLFFGDDEEYEALFEKLIEYPAVDQRVFDIDFSDDLDPFDTEAIMVAEDLSIMDSDHGYMASLSSTTNFYIADPIDYQIGDDTDRLHVEQVDTYSDVPVYREMEQQGGTFDELSEAEENMPFVLNTSGEYSVSEKQDSLAASPLGIYHPAPISLVEDEEGVEPDETVPLLPTIYPGSFVPAPAHGVINVEEASFIKGDEPIDAIRVRVAGITDYDAQAQDIIENLATEFLDMGYEVDVVAGASYQEMDVYVENIGVVSQPWTTLGAAAAIVEGWSGTTGLLGLLFGLIAIVYVCNRLYFFRKGKTAEVKLLELLGWEEKKIRQLFRWELGVLFILSWGISAGVLLAMAEVLEASSLGQIASWHTAFAALGLVGMIGTSEWRWGRQQRKKASPSFNGKRNKKHEPKGTLAGKSIRYYLPYILSAGVQLVLVSVLSVFVYLSMNTTVEQTSVTVLGEYVNFQVSTLHIFIVGSAYALALLSMIESLYSLFSVRQKEIDIFHSLGWRHSHILAHWLREVGFWSAVPIITGHAIGWGLFLAYYPFEMHTLWVVLASLVVFYGFIIVLASVVLHMFLQQGHAPNRKA